MSKTKKILIADDEEAFRLLLKNEFIDGGGFTVFEAKDGEEALALALKEHPDIVLLDIMMPKKEGIGVLKELRKDPWGKDALVYMLTQLSDMSKVADAIENGARGYIVKSERTTASIRDEVLDTLKDQ